MMMDSSNASKEECSESSEFFFFKCSAYQLVDQNWHKMQFQSTYLVKYFRRAHPQTPMFSMLIVFHIMPFAVTLSKGLIHYYYMPQVSKILSTGIASIATSKNKNALTQYSYNARWRCYTMYVKVC